ncbi:hypothetical protein AAVH_19961 [Aphelenchoides avenae]|nr:hypothetical protein AAVH_19961 [Aphelenchus avenae]
MAYCLLMSLALLGLYSGVAGCPGCQSPLDPKSPQVLELADKVIVKMQADINPLSCLFHAEIYNATRQTVAGVMYRFQLRVGHSGECHPPKCAQQVKEKHCQEVGVPYTDLNVKAQIWQKSWEHFEQVNYTVILG